MRELKGEGSKWKESTCKGPGTGVWLGGGQQESEGSYGAGGHRVRTSDFTWSEMGSSGGFEADR